MKEKSKKDIAFDKERIKFRSEIRALEKRINDINAEVDNLNRIIEEKDSIIEQQNEWINRLLEYTEISKDDLQKLIDSEKDKAEIRKKMSDTIKLFGMIGGIGDPEWRI